MVAFVIEIVPELDFGAVVEGHDQWKSTREKAQNEAYRLLCADLGSAPQARAYHVVETRHMRSPVDNRRIP
jgi:hypothetical protein